MASGRKASTAEAVITRHTLLRHLKLKSWSKVVEVLSVRNRWLEIASKIKRFNNESEFLYSPADISTLENQVKRGISPAEAFLEHWSTTGRKQPTVGDLLDLLVAEQLLQAADTLAKQLQVTNSTEVEAKTASPLSEESLELNGNSLESSNSEPSLDELNTVIESVKHKLDEVQNPIQQSLPNVVLDPSLGSGDGTRLNKQASQLPAYSSVLNYRYRYLAEITGNFCGVPAHQGGYKIGEGGFGVVYRAFTQGQWVAIKRLKEAVDKQFMNELEVLCQFKHENLLPLLGYSDDGPYCCLVYLFMLNGSLQERLACAHGTAPISWKIRLEIALGTARGINHLHTFGPKPLVHRDIKSANVLLDENLVPKVGDFGLARIGSKGGNTSSVAFTSNVFGTAVYMAREAHYGEVSIKCDSYSYGVVLLELLTGLPPLDNSLGEDADLVLYIEEKCSDTEDILSMLDVKAGDWNKESAISLYEISKRCLEIRQKYRPTLAEVLPELQLLCSDVDNI